MTILLAATLLLVLPAPGDPPASRTLEPISIDNGEFDRDEDGRLRSWSLTGGADEGRRAGTPADATREREWTDGTCFTFAGPGVTVLSQPIDPPRRIGPGGVRLGLNVHDLGPRPGRIDCVIEDEAGRIVASATLPTGGTAWGRRFVDLAVPEGDRFDASRLVLRHDGDPDGDGVEIDRLSLASIEPDGPGFVSIFNGVDLEGWTGSVHGFGVEDGAIRTHPERAGGNLFTAAEFDDVVLRFEFKLEPGANNGIAIRAPLEGDPAYEGLEVQVLDSGDAKYASLAPWQVHGSIYGIAPALRGYLAPPGDWNSQEIRVEGRRVTVVLNGMRILDCDLEEATRDGPLSGRSHPGLDRRAGHIGFCGHGDVVRFRDLRVRPISGTSAPSSR